jgi:hypothetical protein
MIANHFLDTLMPHLTSDDDPLLWELVWETLVAEASALTPLEKLPAKQFLKIGCCSHWFRPHQSRWTAMGGFAWPSGWHNVSGFSKRGLPELDWSVLYENTAGVWQSADKFSGKDRLEIRVSVPARTARHNQAAIHSLWMPGNQPSSLDFAKKKKMTNGD